VLRHAVVSLVALALIGSTAPTAASAFTREPPEYGRCVKQAGGPWKNMTCTAAAAPGEERYAWVPAFEAENPYNEAHPPRLGFTAVAKPETVIELETTGGGNPGKVKSELKCGSASMLGTVTGPKESLVENILLRGCETSAGKCNSIGAAVGEVGVANLEGLLGIEKEGETKAKDKVANALSPVGGGMFSEISCGGIIVKVRGTALAKVAANAMKSTPVVKLAERRGVQKPDAFVGGPLQTLESVWSNVGTTFEQSGLALTLVQTNEEKLAISTLE
jgi:hypothetical protein